MFAAGWIPSLREKLSSLLISAPVKYAPLSQVNSTRQGIVIGDRVLEKERQREFELSRNDRFRYRTRYFTDSGVIGSKDFVSKNYMRFKHHFKSKNEKNRNRSKAYPVFIL